MDRRTFAVRIPARRLTIGLAVLLAAAVLVPAVALAAGGTFGDDDTSIFEADIEWLAGAGVTRGCNPPANDRFCPDDPVTRGQMAAFMRRFAAFLGAEDGVVDDAEHADVAGWADGAAWTYSADDADTVGGYAPWDLNAAYGLFEEENWYGFDADPADEVDIMELAVEIPAAGFVQVTAVIDYDAFNDSTSRLAVQVCTDLACGLLSAGVDMAQAEPPSAGQAVTTALLPVEAGWDTIRVRAWTPWNSVNITKRSLTALFVPFGFAVDCDHNGDCVTHEPGKAGS